MYQTPYPTDLTDAQWQPIESYLPPPKSGMPKGGRPREVALREILNACFYHVRAGGSWRRLPHDLPPWSTVYHYFCQWRIDGTWQSIHARLREDDRFEAGRPSTPSAEIIDSQSVKATTRGVHGQDAGKKIAERKSHTLVDTIGLLWAILVTPANVSDPTGTRELLSGVKSKLPRMRLVWADGTYGGTLIGWGSKV